MMPPKSVIGRRWCNPLATWNRGYARNAGIRIDHFLLNKLAAAKLTGAGVDREVRGWEKTSDHAPTWITLADKPKRSKRRIKKKES